MMTTIRFIVFVARCVARIGYGHIGTSIMKPPRGVKTIIERGQMYIVVSWWRVWLWRVEAWLEKRRKYTKIESLDGTLYYIEELAFENARERSSGGMGWLAYDGRDWKPFVFWKVRKGITVQATTDEVEKYREAIKVVKGEN